MSDARPAAPDLRAPRGMPKPAPDEQVDPIDTRPSQVPAAPAQAAPTELPAVWSQPAVVQAGPASTPYSPPSPPAPAVGPSSPRRRQDVWVQLSGRVSLETRELLDEILAREGLSQRVVIEKMIRWYHSEA